MSLHLSILASGSSGNCAVVRLNDGAAMLIDAGIGPRVAAKRLAELGLRLTDLSAICVTHLDRDHFSPYWFATAQQLDIRIHCHESKRDHLTWLAQRQETTVDPVCFNGHAFEPIPGVETRALSLWHDAEGSHGFVLDSGRTKLGYATDLGRVPGTLIDAFCGVDTIALESNYDRDMQLTSDRPDFLKHRIMGGRGHLSNEEAFDAIRTILDRCAKKRLALPQHIVLLHRSRQCNCPTRVRALFETDLRIARRLTLAEQHVRTDWLSPRPNERPIGAQLTLF